jgi:type IV pilus assembly protein PilY1
VLWEVHSGMTPTFAELGNVLSEARIGQLADGTWVTIFGNGVHSRSGKALLFIVNAKTGALVHAVDTGVAGNNGLGGAYPVLNARNQIVGVYAGDLKGNLWRFAPKPSEPTQWEARLLFSVGAGLQQAFTATPLAVAHPDGGMVVIAGTGRFFDAADLATTNLQTVYGIRDRTPFGTAPASSATVSGTSTLVMQTITAMIGSSITVTAFDDTTSTQTVTFYDISVNPIDWTTKDGWYFNQPFSGQRMVYPVAGVMGKIAKVDTIVPNNANGDPCVAANPGAGYNYFIDAISGGSPQGPFLDTNGDGVVNPSDIEASGYSTGLDGRDQVLTTSTDSEACSNGGTKSVVVDSSAGSIAFCVPPPPPTRTPTPLNGRLIIKRSQQQLLLR